MARHPKLDFHVYYQEVVAPSHSQWKLPPLAAHEHRLPGVAGGGWLVRWQWNWGFPPAEDFDVWIVYTLHYSPAGQYLMRWHLRRVPWIFWGEGLRPLPGRWRPVAQSAFASALSKSNHIAAIGTDAERDYPRRFPAVPVTPVGYCVDAAPFAAARRARPPDARFAFLFCGQLIRRKGIDLILAAFDRMVQDRLPVRLILLGAGEEAAPCLAALSEEAKALVDARGFVDPPDLPAHFAEADALLLPSRQEGWGVVVNQAIGAGLAVICSDAVGASGLVIPGRNGYRVPVDDGAALEAAMRELVIRPELAATMGAESQAIAAAWTPETGAERWARLLNEVARSATTS